MAIKNSTRERYQRFINGLLLSLSKTEFREYPMSIKIKEFSLFPALTKVLEEMRYISRRKGKSQQFEYIRLKNTQDVDPKHVVDVIKRCNTFYSKVKKYTKVVSQSGILKAMQEIVVEARDLDKATIKIIYRNKNKHDEQYTDATTFAHAILKQKISPSDFEEHQITHSPRSILIKKLTGNGVISVVAINTAKDFYEILTILSKENSGNGFEKKVSNLKQNIKRCLQTAEGNLKRARLIDELCQLHINYKKVPGSRFLYMETYKSLKQIQE